MLQSVPCGKTESAKIKIPKKFWTKADVWELFGPSPLFIFQFLAYPAALNITLKREGITAGME